MIISISPPSSIPLRNIEKQTKLFCGKGHSIKRNICGLLATGSNYMVLVKKREILLSFSTDDIDAISFLQKYLIFLFQDVLIGVDLENPVTENLKFVKNLPQGVIS